MDAPEMALSKENLEIEPNVIRYEYDPWLLDDHPLRSHPTECIPGLGSFFAEWYISVQKCWMATLLRAVCLILACLAAFQCLRALPSPPGKGLPRPATVSRLSSRNWQATCTFPRLDDRPNALAQSVAAGCEGFRTDIWLHDNEVQMGISRPVFQAAHDLHLSLDLLLTKLELRHTSADTQMPLNAETPDDKIENRAFMLVLDAKSPIHELYPHLISHLDVLRQRGYLTHWDGAQIVERPLTIVVTGQSLPDCSSSSYSDLFWSETAGGISADDIMNTHLLPICAI